MNLARALLRRPRHLRPVAGATVGTLVAVGALSSVAMATANAATGCAVNYTVESSWSNGFQGAVTVTNTGDALSNWNLTWSFADGQKISQLWSGTYSQSGAAVSVKSAGWNAALSSGTSASFGFVASSAGTNSVPTGFALNGVSCSGTNKAPSVALTTPQAGGAYTAPASVPLTVVASDPDGSVAKVEYYANDNLVATATSAPFSTTWTNVAAGDYSIHAKVYDNLGASSMSEPAGMSVLAGAAVTANQSALTVAAGKSATYTVVLTQKPSADVTVTTTRASGNAGLSVSEGATLTFTPENWATPQKVTISASESGSTGGATFTTSGTGYGASSVSATLVAAATSSYDQRFLDMYSKLHAKSSGYFSSEGVPYHSIETLIVEAPDQGHESTSEGMSYYMWLEATYGRISGDWSGYNTAWSIAEKYYIPTKSDQPTNSGYKASSPATYAPESDSQEDYPAQLSSSVAVGKDPIADELKSAYGNADIYGMHWIIDGDNVYGFGKCGDGKTKPAYFNTFQRGSSESTWETIPQPSCDMFKFGGKNGFLDLFTKDSSYSKQWKFTDAPDADARAVQAAYWADKWATAQGKQSSISASSTKAAKMGDYLRYAMYDKYFKKIGNCTSTSCAAGTGKDSSHYLISWYYAWGGSADTSNPWAWRIGDSAAHQGYQNPLAAWALSSYANLKPKSSTGATDWSTSLKRQLEFYQWLQSTEGGIAGGATNSWQGAYAAPPSNSSTFYGMAYDYQPVWHDPSSNKWFGFQAWSMERVAEYYYVTGDSTAKKVLDKWVAWVLKNSAVNADGSYEIPNDLSWSGQPDTWKSGTTSVSNSGLHVTVENKTTDIGVAGSLAKALTYYAAKANNSSAKTFAKAMLDAIWKNNQDDKGVSTPEQRTDYSRFNDKVYVPSSFSGTMPNGDKLDSSSTFLSIRSWYKNDPDWSKVQAYLDGGEAPTFTYHRFWAQADVATAMAVYGELFPSE